MVFQTSTGENGRKPEGRGVNLKLAPNLKYTFGGKKLMFNDRLNNGALLVARSDPHFVIESDRVVDQNLEAPMNEKEVQHLQETLALKQKELELMMAIDRVRDTAPDPGSMLNGIANLLVEKLDAQVCLIFLTDRETQETELKAFTVREDWFTDAVQAALFALARRAAAVGEIAVWQPGAQLEELQNAALPKDLHLMACPIIFGLNECLGAILLGRLQRAFTQSELALVRTAEDQIDSAVVQGYAAEKLQQHQRELETIFRLDRIRDQGLPLNDMLNAVIQELTRTIQAELGFIMLYDLSGKKLETRASTHASIAALPYFDEISQIVNDSLEKAELVCRNNLGQALRSVMCLPLILNEQIIGVLGVVNRFGAPGFSAADRRLLLAMGSQLDTAIYERNEIRILRRVLGRSVDPRVMERLLANPDMDFLKGELLELTVLYADIRGSTALAESINPGQLVEFIKDYLSHMTDIILYHEGTIDKFVGDEVMALFGAPIPQEDHALRAVRVGLAMQIEYGKVSRMWQSRGLPHTSIGIGIATGEMIAGEMGGLQRTNYTVIGRAANLGSRICESAPPGKVWISQKTYDLVKDQVEAAPIPGQLYKGVPGEVTVYEVTRLCA
jgi:class 3 adenylate cyclase